MKSFLRSLFRNADLPLFIVVVQYYRNYQSVGQEQEFHWAIAVVSDLERAAKAHCRCYQILNSICITPIPHTVWALHIHRSAVLGKTGKWRGGVIIGTLKTSELDELDNVLSTHEPVIKSDNWNCRDWVMEAIGLMSAKGWISTPITSQERLLPTLRVVNKASLKALAKKKHPVVWNLDQNVRV